MQARLTAFLLWAAVAATIVFWALRLGARAPSVPRQAVPVSTAAGARGDLDRLLGHNAPAAAEEAPVSADAGRFQLVGVVAPRGSGGDTEGLAVIAVDGKPARTYRVGGAVDDRWVLQSVRTRGASLGPRGGNAQVRLELPPPPVASTGTLPAAGSEEPAAAMQPGGRLPPNGAAPRNLPPGQMPPGMARQQIPQPMPQQMPQDLPQDMPVQEEAPVQQEVEPVDPAQQGQGG